MSNQRGDAIVVGAGPGLSRAIAARFASAGHPIARDPERLMAIAAELTAAGATLRTAVADASDPPMLAAAVRDLADAPDIRSLVYNATQPGGSLTAASLADQHSANDVNLHSPVLAVQQVVKNLSSTMGTVLLSGGGLALYPVPAVGVLSVGKAQLRTAALTLAGELRAVGVRVRMITVTGPIAAGTAFDPDRIAETCYAAHVDPDGPVETVYTGTAGPVPSA